MTPEAVPVDDDNDQVVLNEDEHAHRINRSGMPTERIGIALQQINIKVKDIVQRNQINEMIFKVVEEEK